jgi:multiple sugar transport system substrate-binding protein
MKSKFVFLILALIVCSLVFMGCKKAQQPAAGPVTLKWAMWDYDLTVYYKPLVDAYQAKNPNIKIECVDLGSADFMTVVSTQLSGGADLDIISIKDMPGYMNLVRQNRLEPLNAVIKSNNIDTKLYNGVVEQLTVNNEVYTLPFRTDFWLIYYNKDIFDKAGVPYPTNDMTLEQYEALARRVTSGSGAGKIYGAHFHTWRSATTLFSIMDGKNTVVGGKYDFMEPTYNWVLKLQDDGIVQNYATLKTSGTHYSGVFFNSQIAMMNMGSWFIATQIAQVAKGEATSKNWGLAKNIHPAGVPAGTTIGTLTGMSVNRNSKNKEAAIKFLQFLTGPDGAAVLAKTGTIPAIMNQEVINSITALPGFPTDANSKAALSYANAYLEMPLHEKAADIEVVLNEEHDSIMLKNKSVAAGIAAMNLRIGQILGR